MAGKSKIVKKQKLADLKQNIDLVVAPQVTCYFYFIVLDITFIVFFIYMSLTPG